MSWSLLSHPHQVTIYNHSLISFHHGYHSNRSSRNK